MKRVRRRWPPEGKKFNKFCRKYLRMHLLKWRQVEEAIALHRIEEAAVPTLWQAVNRALKLHKTPTQIDQILHNVHERHRARNRLARRTK